MKALVIQWGNDALADVDVHHFTDYPLRITEEIGEELLKDQSYHLVPTGQRYQVMRQNSDGSWSTEEHEAQQWVWDEAWANDVQRQGVYLCRELWDEEAIDDWLDRLGAEDWYVVDVKVKAVYDESDISNWEQHFVNGPTPATAPS